MKHDKMVSSKFSSIRNTEVLRRKSMRHSNRVRFLKKFLPFISFACIALILIWPFLTNFNENKIMPISEEHQKVIKKNKVLNPKIVSRDKNGQLFTIKSLYAEQHDKEVTSFDNPQSALLTNEGSSISTSSNYAVLDKKNNTIKYTGNVRLASDQNYSLNTLNATHDLSEQTIQGDAPVNASSSSYTIHSDQGFKSSAEDIHFKGNVNLKIPDSALKDNDV